MRIKTASILFIITVLLSGAVHLSQTSTSQQTQTPIKHLVILIMENHSFDNLFGTYGQIANGTLASNVTLPLNLIKAPPNQALTPVPTGTFKTGDPAEGYSNYHMDWNNGSMNGFLNGSGPNSLLYYTASQMGPEWYLAHQYSIGDMYFSSTLSETLPNRIYSLSGFSPVKQDQLSPPPFVLYDQTIFNEMDHNNVSWGYYFQNPYLGFYPLYYVYGITSHFSHVHSWGNFTDSVLNNHLPAVSWVSPVSGLAYGYSQHPPDNVLAGEIWLFYMVHLIMESPVWDSTAIMITYDEGGGFYDQVAPPNVAGHQLGFRVPFILISPYAKENYVSNTVMSHTSILGFIDYNWNMPALNNLVLHSNLPIDMFNFNNSYASGNIIRSPLNFTPELSKFIPKLPKDSTTVAGSFSNVGIVFPGILQYNPSSLPYNKSGQSNFSLYNISSQISVKENYAFTPWFLEPYIILPAVVFSISFLSYGVYHLLFKRRKMKKKND